MRSFERFEYSGCGCAPRPADPARGEAAAGPSGLPRPDRRGRHRAVLAYNRRFRTSQPAGDERARWLDRQHRPLPGRAIAARAGYLPPSCLRRAPREALSPVPAWWTRSMRGWRGASSWSARRPDSARRPCWPTGSGAATAGGLAVAGRRRQRPRAVLAPRGCRAGPSAPGDRRAARALLGPPAPTVLRGTGDGPDQRAGGPNPTRARCCWSLTTTT